MNYLRGLEKGSKIVKWDLSLLLPIIQERLKTEDKRKLVSLISFLNGEIGLEELERRIKIS